MFCIDCGTWTGASSAAASPAPSIDLASATGAGTMTPGSYGISLQHRDTPGKRRVLAAMASVALAAVVGLTAIYVAMSPGGRSRDPIPAAALMASSTPNPVAATSTSVPSAVVAAVATAVEPEDPPEPGTDTATADTEPTEAFVSLVAVSSISDEIEATTDNLDPGATEVTAATGASSTTDATNDVEAPLRHNDWICDGQVRLQDPRGRNWSLGRVSFLGGPGYERVVLHIDRLGPGSGEPPTVTAEAFATGQVRGSIPGVRRPSSGQTTVSLHLTDGIDGNLGLRGYRPSGMQDLKEFSVFPAARGSSRVLISTAGDKCFRLRAPAWTASGPNVRKAQILLDIKT